jgi:DNA polymerase-3 subunit epsilon
VLFSSPPWDSVVYWSLDLETGGLDARTDAILAVGMVPVRGAHVRLGEAYRTLVQPEDGMAIDPASVRAHQLVWGELREAPPLPQVLREVSARLADAILIVHHRAVDVAFLRRAFQRHALEWPRPRVVDTVALAIAAAHRERMRAPEMPGDLPPLNLTAVRRRYGLPDYQAHDALTDAVATAELFLMLRKVLGARSLRDLRPSRSR